MSNKVNLNAIFQGQPGIDFPDIPVPATVTVPVGRVVPPLPIPIAEGWSWLGWFKDSNYTQPFAAGGYLETDISLYGKWEKGGGPTPPPPVGDTSVVTFVWDDQLPIPSGYSPPPAVIVNTNFQYSAPTATVDFEEPSGYNFVGWYTKNMQDVQLHYDLFINGDRIIEDTTLYGKWEVGTNQIMVYYGICEGDNPTAITGVLPTTNPDRYTAGSNPYQVVAPINDPFWTFDKWYTNKEGTSPYIPANLTVDTTLYGKWTYNVPDYDITYSLSTLPGPNPDQLVVLNPDTVPEETKYEPQPPLPIDGYVFDKWSETPNGLTPFVHGTEINGAKTLYATYQPDPNHLYIAVTYDYGVGGTGDFPTKAYRSGVVHAEDTPPASLPDGFGLPEQSADKGLKGDVYYPLPPKSIPMWTFKDWYETEELLPSSTYVPRVLTSDLQLFGKWELDTDNAELIYDYGDSKPDVSYQWLPNPNPQVFPIGTHVIATPGASYGNWSFAGWFYEKDYQTEYEGQHDLVEDLTLYGKWTQISDDKWSIYFTNGTGTNPDAFNMPIPNPLLVNKGASTDLPSAHPVTDNWHFDGWFDNAALTGDPISPTSYMPTANIILYAKWHEDEQSASVTFTYWDGDGVPGVGHPEGTDGLPPQTSVEVAKGSIYAIPADQAQPDVEGWVKLGYFYDAPEANKR